MRNSFGLGQPQESGLFLDPSGRVVLECMCGEKLVLLGQEQDWREERRTAFRCECERELTLAEDRVSERALALGELLRGSTKAPRGVYRRSTCPNGAARRLPDRDSSPANGTARASGRCERGLG